MSYYLENSNFGYDGRFQIFNALPVDTSIKEQLVVSYRPIAPVRKREVIEFIIPSTAQYYVDLSRTRLQLSVRIVDDTDKPVSAIDLVGLINYPLNTLFSNVEFTIQQKDVTASVGSNYAYKAILDSLLTKDSDELVSSLQASGFYKDTAGWMNSIAPDNGNRGLLSRWELTRSGSTAALQGQLCIDVMKITKFLPNGLAFKLRLFPQRDTFTLMYVGTKSYHVEITDASLHMQYIAPTNELIVGHHAAIEKGPALYAFERSNIKSWVIPAGLTVWTIDSLFADECPNQLLIALTTSKGYTGDAAVNPFDFSHHDLEYLSFQIEGQSATAAVFSPDYSNKHYTKEFLSLYGPENDYKGNINYEEYRGGYCIYKVKLDTGIQATHTNMSRRAQTRLVFRFKEALSEAVVVIAYGLFSATLQIDKSRNVYVT